MKELDQTVLDSTEQDLFRIVTEYADRLEAGEMETPENVASTVAPGDDRLLEMLRSVKWLYQANLSSPHSNCSQNATVDQHQSLTSRSTSDRVEKTASLSLANGAILGDYRVLSEIGRGAMGCVFEAEQVSLRRRVAIKVLPPAATLDQRQLARFQIESQAAARLQHPNIVPIHCVGNQDGIYYYSMQLVEHRPFRFPMESSQVAKIGESVARALNYAHGEGVIHRDIKPSNLLMEPSGKVWITDFGLARLQDDANRSTTGAIVGTMRYMSPEQACGSSKWVDHRTDIYALGVTLYEMLTGRCPYDSVDRVLFLAELEKGEPTPIRKLKPNVARDLETIVLKAMSAHPEERYENANELADDLARFYSGQVILARRPSFLDRLSKWTRRNRSWVTAGVIMWGAFTLILLTSFGLLWRAERATRTANRESQASAEEAQVFFTQARKVVDHFGVSLSQRLAELPGAESTRLEVLQDTLRYYRDFIDQAGNNPSRQEEIGLTHLKIAKIAEHLDAYDEAIQAYQMAENTFVQLQQQESSCALAANGLGVLLTKVGYAQEADEAFIRALQYFEHAHGRLTISNYPSERLEIQHRTAVTRINRSHTLDLLKKESESYQSLCLAIDQIARLEKESLPEEINSQLPLDHAKACGAMAQHFFNSDLAQATDWNDKAIQLLDQYCKQNETRTEFDNMQATEEAVTDWLIALCNRASIFQRRQRVDEAIHAIEDAFRLVDRYKALFPMSEPIQDQIQALSKLYDELRTLQANVSSIIPSVHQRKSLTVKARGY